MQQECYGMHKERYGYEPKENCTIGKMYCFWLRAGKIGSW